MATSPRPPALFPDGVTNLDDTAGATSSDTPTTNTLTFSGLSSSTDYIVQIWALDQQWNDGSTTFIWDTTAGTGGSATYLGNIVNDTSPAPTSNDDYSLTVTRTADGSGNLNFGFVTSSGGGQINGFEISAVPEPASFALVLSLGAALVVFRRRMR